MYRKFVRFIFVAAAVLISGCIHRAHADPESAAGISTAVPLPAVEVERLREYHRIQDYLRRNVFPAWDGILPPILLIGPSCQWVINYGPRAPAGFVNTGQVLVLDGLTHSQVYSRRNIASGPESLEVEYTVPATAYTYGASSRSSWMVMSTYECFKRDYNGSLGFYLGVLAHETFHPFEFRQPSLKRRMEILNKPTFTHFHNSHAEFARAVNAEMTALKTAILAPDRSTKRAQLTRFFSLQESRRKQWITTATRSWMSEEPLLEAVEGCAEYMNARLRLDAAGIPYNSQLAAVDPNYNHYREFAQYSLAKAIEDAFHRPSYVQNVGVLEIMLLNQLDPRWPDELFQTEGFAESLLRRWLHRH